MQSEIFARVVEGEPSLLEVAARIADLSDEALEQLRQEAILFEMPCHPAVN